MHRIRRLSAIGTLALMLSMTFIGGSAACDVSMAGDATDAAGMMDGSMGDMDMPADNSPEESSNHDSTPCSLPSAPPNCHGVALCAPLAVITEAVAMTWASHRPGRVAIGEALEPPSPTFVPESPPPRVQFSAPTRA